jgi:hypothetical protein
MTAPLLNRADLAAIKTRSILRIGAPLQGRIAGPGALSGEGR